MITVIDSYFYQFKQCKYIMNNKNKSKLSPANSAWIEDLPKEAEMQKYRPYLDQDDELLSYLDNVWCEWVKPSSLDLRGGLLLASSIFIGGIFLFYHDVISIMKNSGEIDWYFLLMYILMIYIVIICIRLDVMLPIEFPVRLNRSRNKLYVYDCKHNFNLFSRWKVEVTEYDWNDVQAEILNVIAYDGRIATSRYSLVAAICEPGTYNVIRRIPLVKDSLTASNAGQVWSWCCHYMENGVSGLPSQSRVIRHKKRDLNNSFLRWFPFLAWGEAGARVKQTMKFGAASVVLILFSIVLSPLLLVLVALHFIVMQLAPEAKWPADIDIESRTSPEETGTSSSSFFIA